VQQKMAVVPLFLINI